FSSIFWSRVGFEDVPLALVGHASGIRFKLCPPCRSGGDMGPFVILAGVFAVFIPALMLPGPDFIAVVRSSMTRGTVAGLWTTLGVSLCLGIYAALSLAGLSAILIEYQLLAWAVRILGGCYLIYLGLKLLFAQPVRL